MPEKRLVTGRQAAIRIIRTLHSEGYQGLLAGVCVRDMLLGRSAKDYDVATDAHPKDVIKLFRRTLKVGAKFGVVMVLTGDTRTEVATFRTETGYADGRHPDVVAFSDAAQDAARRDFTINGMFYDPIEKKVIDYVAGQVDLKKNLIRTIGRPEKRFSEDYLRMLRAIRFSTQLGFTIEPETFSAIRKNAENISRISAERIAMEIEAILTDPGRAAAAAQFVKSKLAEAIFPGLSIRKIKTGIEVLSHLRKKVDFPLALAAFFAGCETNFAIEKCSVLRLSRNQSKHIKFLLAGRGKLLNSEMSLAELKLILSEPYFRDLYELQRAIQKADQLSLSALLKLQKRARALRGQQLRPKPLLNGHKLIRLGAVPGPQVGQLAEEMYIAQLEGLLKTTTEAKNWVKKWLQKHKNLFIQ